MEYCLVIHKSFSSSEQEQVMQVVVEAQKQLPGVCLMVPVILEFSWFEKKCEKNIDEVVLRAEAVLKGLVQAGVLLDESKDSVIGLVQRFFVDKVKTKVEIKIKAV